jgi:N-methylhydantoinase B
MDVLRNDLIWNRLLAATDEQAATLIRAAFSPIVREAGDLSACIFLPNGDMLAQARTGTPGHINSMANAIRHFISAFPPGTLTPGDVLITNDPHSTSGQLHDHTVVTPVFHRGRLVAYVGSLCHLTDVGGRGLGIEAHSQFEEGILVPIEKLFTAGEPNALLIRMMGANVRTPKENLGDLYAQTAGNAAAGEAIVATLEAFGLPDLEAPGQHIVEASERAMRDAIRRIPPGRYPGRVTSDGIDEPIELTCVVEVGDGHVHVDWTGSSPASPHGINVVINYTHAYTTYAISCLIGADIPNNTGSLRPVTVSAPPGSILNATWPAPLAARHIIGHFLPMAIINALAPVIGGNVVAEGAANIWLTQFRGSEPAGGSFSFTMSAAGGMGARTNKDGLSATAFPSGVMGIPVEITESSAPLLVTERSLIPDSGGAGRFRGGLGQRLGIAPLSSEGVTVSVLLDRLDHPATGLAGGSPGRTGRAWIEPGDRAVTKASFLLRGDERLILELPGGGGYGPPGERARDALASDLRQGYVTAEGLARDYGVDPIGVANLGGGDG